MDLKRDISYDKNGELKPTKVIYSAYPYVIEPIAPFLGNLTCNPGLLSDLFLNNPEANVGNEFKDRDEVVTALGDVLGPGCDISIELNNPFDPEFAKILDEAERFREILSPWRVVIKVPHTGPVNHENYRQLLTGDGHLDTAFDTGATADMLRGHNLALKLYEHGFKVNFTLMFEPHQAQMALQARPAFINAFIRHRRMQASRIVGLLTAYELSGDTYFVGTSASTSSRATFCPLDPTASRTMRFSPAHAKPSPTVPPRPRITAPTGSIRCGTTCAPSVKQTCPARGSSYVPWRGRSITPTSTACSWNPSLRT